MLKSSRDQTSSQLPLITITDSNSSTIRYADEDDDDDISSQEDNESVCFGRSLGLASDSDFDLSVIVRLDKNVKQRSDTNLDENIPQFMHNLPGFVIKVDDVGETLLSRNSISLPSRLNQRHPGYLRFQSIVDEHARYNRRKRVSI